MSFKKTIEWVDKELAENCNDTVHDFLAFLAECAPKGADTLSGEQRAGK
ncbi:MAG: hypothetical protein M0Z70_00365 [Nitrospiraceae bacterium]|jgi:hypothetical protein|nr:hypothetical protein [Nitrospiraceae bacterium]